MKGARLCFATLLLLSATAHADPIAAPDIYIIDGDTIAVRGKRIRFVGFDAPEPSCSNAERMKSAVISIGWGTWM